MNKENNLTTFIQNNVSEGTLPHAFLVETNDFELQINQIYELFCLSKCLINKKIENNPDVLIIEEENNIIDKSKILNIQSFLLTKPLLSTCKIYFIKNCEKMNQSAANKLLKTLEEPDDNIYAILLTDNIGSIIETIKSRCVIFKSKNELISTSNYSDIVVKIINCQYNNFSDFLILKKELLEYDRNQIMEIFNNAKKEILHSTIDNKRKLLKYNIFENIEQGLKFNTNVELSLDKLYIEMEQL